MLIETFLRTSATAVVVALSVSSPGMAQTGNTGGDRGHEIAALRERIQGAGPSATHAIRAIGRFGTDAAIAAPDLRAVAIDPDTDPYVRAGAVCALLQIGDGLDQLKLLRDLPEGPRIEAVFGVVQYAVESGGSLFGTQASPAELAEIVVDAMEAIPSDHSRADELARAVAWMASDALDEPVAKMLEAALLGLADRAPEAAAIPVRPLDGQHPITGDDLPEDERREAALRMRSDPGLLIDDPAGGVRAVGWTFRPPLAWIPGSEAERTLVLRDASTGAYGRRIVSVGTARPPLVVMDDGRAVVGGGLKVDGTPTVQVIDLSSGEILRQMELPGRRAVISSLDAVGDTVIVARYRELYRYDLGAEGGEPIRIANDYAGQGTAIRVLPDGSRFVVPGSDHALEVRNLEDGSLVDRLEGHLSTVLCLDVSNDTMVSGDRQGDLIVWDTSELAPVRRLEPCPSGVWSVDLSADGSRIAAGAGTVFRQGDMAASEADGTVRVFDGDGEVIARFQTFPDHLSAVRLSPDGKRVFALGTNRFSYAWRIEAGS